MYTPNARLVLRTLRGTTYLVPIGGDWTQSPELIELDEVAALIVRCIPNTLEGIAQVVTDEYNVEYDTARNDTAEFLDELISMGLVTKRSDT